MKAAFKNAFRDSVLSRMGNHPKVTMKDVGEKLKENYDPRDSFFRKSKEGHSVNNLWSGYELGGKGNLLMGAGLLGGGSIVVGDPQGLKDDYNLDNSVEQQTTEQDIESLQSTRADGLGYQAQVGNSQMVTPSGDLVFAMHKTRHYGQL